MTTPTPERSVEEIALEHAYPATQYNTQRVVAVSRVVELLQAERQKQEEMVEEIKYVLPQLQREKCDEEDECGLCNRGLQRKCHAQEISRVINEIRSDVLETLTQPNNK